MSLRTYVARDVHPIGIVKHRWESIGLLKDWIRDVENFSEDPFLREEAARIKASLKEDEEKNNKAKSKEAIVIGGVYQHFKGGEYKVLAIVKHSESQQEMVLYVQIKRRPFCPDPVIGDNMWVRPIHMWLEDVEYQGSIVPRFYFLRVDSI